MLQISVIPKIMLLVKKRYFFSTPKNLIDLLSFFGVATSHGFKINYSKLVLLLQIFIIILKTVMDFCDFKKLD